MRWLGLSPWYSSAAVLEDFRLFQLASPNLPIGAFTYSQGLEWAVEAGWVSDVDALHDWLRSVLWHSLVLGELPLIRRAMRATDEGDLAAFEHWAQALVATRETRELRTEEHQRGAAFLRVITRLPLTVDPLWHDALAQAQATGFGYAAAQWGLKPDAACRGYLWSWLEGAVVAGVKLVPLGQTQGQQLMAALSTELVRACEASRDIDDDDIGPSTFAMAIASSRHETQYTRLYRS